MQIVIDLPNENYQVILTKIMLDSYGCKITEIPKGHGRLIDADVLADGFEDNYEFCEVVNATPTIIEADKEV